MGIKVKQVRSEPVPTGEYLAKMTEIVEEAGQFGQQLKFKYELMTPGFEGRQLVGWVSKTFTAKSKLYAWTRAAFGRDIPPDWDFDSDALIGRTVTLVVVQAQGKDGSEFSKIDSVRAARINGARPAAQPVPAAPGSPNSLPDWLADNTDKTVKEF